MQTLRETTNIVNRVGTHFDFPTYTADEAADNPGITQIRTIIKFGIANTNKETVQILSGNALNGTTVLSAADLLKYPPIKLSVPTTAAAANAKWFPYLRNQTPTGRQPENEHANIHGAITDTMKTNGRLRAPVALYGLFPYPIFQFKDAKEIPASEGTLQQ